MKDTTYSGNEPGQNNDDFENNPYHLQNLFAEGLERVDDLLSKAPALIYIIQGKNLIYLNKTFTVISGYDFKDMKTENIFSFVHPDDLEKVITSYRRRLAGEYVPPYEARIAIKNGGYLWVYFSAEVIQYQNKPAVMGIALDLTPIKQTEHALRMSEEKFAKAFETSPNAMAIYTLSEGRFIEVNDQFSLILGYSREETIGNTARDLNLWLNKGERLKWIKTITKFESVRNIEVKNLNKSGKLIEGLISAERIEFNGETCILIVYTDISEQKRLTRELARLDQMNMVGEIAASIGHEIRNPITSVRGFLQYFNEMESMQDYQEFFGIMIDELDRANQIITEFLSLAKNKRIELKPNNINDIIIAMTPLIKIDSLNQDKYLDISLQDIPDIMLDGNEIRQMIFNLILNGLDAMEKNKTIHLRTELDDNGDVLLIVEDEGTGINNDVLPNIFTPFFTTKELGTGLGLAVCYSIAVRHQAFIQVDTDNCGTRFTVRFSQN